MEYPDFNAVFDNSVPNEQIIKHGIVFDDGRRWCGVCQKPKRTCTSTDSQSLWANKCCPKCFSLWPEYLEEYANSDDYENDIVFLRIH